KRRLQRTGEASRAWPRVVAAGWRRMDAGVDAITAVSAHRIGFAIARRLAQDGAHVVVSSRKQQNVDRAVAVLQGEGLSVTGTVCHVGKAEDRERLVATALEHCGGVDFLVCVAGVNPLVGSTLGASEQVWNKVRPRKEDEMVEAFHLEVNTWKLLIWARFCLASDR
uniref:Dehydrogenase/reductase SDR family member 4 n=1 Tax=Equus asinus asinus TaxID=83772 RepID=A0A8C4LVP0_EQUAS